MIQKLWKVTFTQELYISTSFPYLVLIISIPRRIAYITYYIAFHLKANILLFHKEQKKYTDFVADLNILFSSPITHLRILQIYV